MAQFFGMIADRRDIDIVESPHANLRIAAALARRAQGNRLMGPVTCPILVGAHFIVH